MKIIFLLLISSLLLKKAINYTVYYEIKDNFIKLLIMNKLRIYSQSFDKKRKLNIFVSSNNINKIS